MNVDLVELLKNFGFPVVFCFLLFWQNIKVIRENTKSINSLERSIDSLGNTLRQSLQESKNCAFRTDRSESCLKISRK